MFNECFVFSCNRYAWPLISLSPTSWCDKITLMRVSVWTPGFDMTSIPDDVFQSEYGRRNNARRATKSGGKIWGHHNPESPRCRCVKCNTARARKRKNAAADR